MSTETKARHSVNAVLADICNGMHDELPVAEIADLLETYDFQSEVMSGIYCGWPT